MSVMNEQPELLLGSRTQNADEVQKVLNDLGFEGIEVDTLTDAPPPEAEPKADDAPPNAESDSATTDSSALLPEAGDIDGDGDGEDPEAVTEAAQTQQERKKSGSARKKERITQLQSENEALKRQLAERSAEKPAEAIAPKAEEPPVEIPEERAQPTLEDVDEDGNPKYKDYDEVILALFD